jgi:23S rRNA (guanine745-N1)-methyltransferase
LNEREPLPAPFCTLTAYLNLLCPVRDCRRFLTRDHKFLVCPVSHSFDIARSGYINLLQPQDRRSKYPGDSVAAVNARRSLHDLGVTRPILAALAESLALNQTDSLLDVGSGDGFYLGSLAQQSKCTAAGIEISVPAIEAAARRYPDCEWIVANADRFIPYPDHSFSHIVSITARMNPGEFQRVLKPDGKLLIALPAPDDLIELRGAGRNRVARTIDSFAPGFALTQQRRVTTTAQLSAAEVGNILLSIYRPLQPRPPEATQVTFSLDLLLFHLS